MPEKTINNVQNTLKEVWASEEVAKLFDEGALLMDIIEHGSQETETFKTMGEYDGKYVIMPLHTAPNPNAGVGVAEGYEYPQVGGQTYQQAKYRARPIVSGMGVTHQVITRADGGDRSAFNYAAREDSAQMANTRRWMNWHLAREGSGRLTTVATSNIANSWTNSTGILVVSDVTHFQVDMEVIVRVSTAGNPSGVPAAANSLPTAWPVTDFATGNPAVVSAIDSTNTTITLQTTAGAVFDYALTGNTSYGLYRFDEQGRNPWGIDAYCISTNPVAMGFNGAATVTATDDGGLLNVPGALDLTNSTISGFWSPISSTDMTLDLSNSAPTMEDDIQTVIAQILAKDSMLYGEEGSDGKAGAIVAVSRMPIWWKIVNALNAGQRTDIRTKIVDGRYDAVHYGIITFAYDQTVDNNAIWGFAPRYLYRLIIEPFHWEDGDMYEVVWGNLNRRTSKRRKYLCSQQQLCANSRRPFFKFTNVAG